MIQRLITECMRHIVSLHVTSRTVDMREARGWLWDCVLRNIRGAPLSLDEMALARMGPDPLYVQSLLPYLRISTPRIDTYIYARNREESTESDT